MNKYSMPEKTLLYVKGNSKEMVILKKRERKRERS